MSNGGAQAPRAVRNNNPGNLDAGDHWQGLMPRSQMSAAQMLESRFAVFASPRWGFRALGIILRNYERLYADNTVREIISRWAPAKENDTAAYIRAVCDAIGREPDAIVDVHDPAMLKGLARAIACHESGGWFFQNAELDAGIDMAEQA